MLCYDYVAAAVKREERVVKRATSTAKNAHVNSKRSVSSVERSQVHHSKGTGEESNDSRCAILKKATIRKARIKTVFPDLE